MPDNSLGFAFEIDLSSHKNEKPAHIALVPGTGTKPDAANNKKSDTVTTKYLQRYENRICMTISAAKCLLNFRVPDE